METTKRIAVRDRRHRRAGRGDLPAAGRRGFAVVALHTPGNTRVPEWLAAQDAQGYRFDAVAVDVAAFASCAAAVAAIRERHGPVSVLVNNAGITRDASFRKMTRADWETCCAPTSIEFNMTKQVIETCLSAGVDIVNTLSLAAAIVLAALASGMADSAETSAAYRQGGRERRTAGPTCRQGGTGSCRGRAQGRCCRGGGRPGSREIRLAMSLRAPPKPSGAPCAKPLTRCAMRNASW